MGTQIIKQDDGKFGLFSTISDRIWAIDCDEAEMIKIWKERAAEKAENEMRQWLQEAKGERPSPIKPMTLKQALHEHIYHETDLAQLYPEYQGEVDYDKFIKELSDKLKVKNRRNQ